MRTQARLKRRKRLIQLYSGVWRSRLSKRQEKYAQIGRMHDLRVLRNGLLLWKRGLKEKQVAKWKDDMRKRMVFMKSRQDNRVRELAWTVRAMLHLINIRHFKTCSYRNGDQGTNSRLQDKRLSCITIAVSAQKCSADGQRKWRNMSRCSLPLKIIMK